MMLNDPKFDPERFVSKLNSQVFGIDLHWAIHAQGAIELACIVKKHHSNVFIVLGGLTSTYFHYQIMKDYPFVDYILRGNSAEEPLFQLLNCLEEKRVPEKVPNITGRDATGKIHANPISYVPQSLDDYKLDYKAIAGSALKFRNVDSLLPWHDWFDYPVVAFLTCKGCIFNCVACGSSQYSYRNVCNRFQVAWKSQKLFVEEIRAVENTKIHIYLVGDIFMIDQSYVESFSSLIRREGIDCSMVFELFKPISNDMLEKIAKAASRFNLLILPETHDEDICYTFGRMFKNKDLEEMISNALRLRCKRLDVYFMIGLPKQTLQSTLETAEYVEKLLKKYGSERRLHPFIASLAPFIDPGSLVFDYPEKYGYRLFVKSFREYREVLLSLTWKQPLGYETSWMKRDEIVYATCKTAQLINSIKTEHELISQDDLFKILSRISPSLKVLKEADVIG